MTQTSPSSSLPDDLRALREAAQALEVLGEGGDSEKYRATWAQFDAAESRILSTVSALIEERDALKQQLHEGKTKNDQPQVPEPSRDATCAHCWHPWGLGSGGVGSDGSMHASGKHRCCHCGKVEPYNWNVGPRTPPMHGPYYAEIVYRGANGVMSSVVLAVDPSRSSPTDETRTTYAGRSPEETP